MKKQKVKCTLPGFEKIPGFDGYYINTLEEMGVSGDLCNYCSYMEGSHYPGEICEGNYCEEAYYRYLTEIEEEE